MVGLWANKTLLTKPGDGPDLAISCDVPLSSATKGFFVEQSHVLIHHTQ